MDSALSTIFTAGLLAGAYNDKHGCERKAHAGKAALLHSFDENAPVSLCGKITINKACTDYGNDADAPTCPRCLKKDPRFAK